MEVIRSSDFIIERPTAVCIGKFDGVHIGHQKLLGYIVAQKARGLCPAVFSFDPTPEELFSGKKVGLLCSNEEKESYLEATGVDIVIEYPLTFERAAMEPEDFVKNVLLGQMNMRYIAAGVDISFGKNGSGDRQLMEKMAAEYGFDCEIIEKVRVDGEVVSASRVREAVRAGRMEETFRLLGRKRI